MFNSIYRITNENVYAVKNALNPSEGDSIYSILGSGDIPLMFIENNANVFSIDNNKEQINYVKKRVSSIDADMEFFLNIRNEGELLTGNETFRNIYFKKLNTENIKNNLGNLEISLGNFFNLKIDNNNFNKVYLSNAFDYHLDRFAGLSKNKYEKKVDSFFRKFNPGTLFYLTSMYDLDFECCDFLSKEKLSGKFPKRDYIWNEFLLRKI